MTTRLRASTLATVAATFLSFGSAQGTFADGRGDWDGYAWQKIAVSDCTGTATALTCPAYRQKWDWKRNQWVDVAITLDPMHGTVALSQRLTDNDPHDTDYVCVTALIVDANGADLVAHHQNWQISAGQVLEEQFTYTSAALSGAKTIHIGSKQCRDGAGQDDDTHARVLAGLPE